MNYYLETEEAAEREINWSSKRYVFNDWELYFRDDVVHHFTHVLVGIFLLVGRKIPKSADDQYTKS